MTSGTRLRFRVAIMSSLTVVACSGTSAGADRPDGTSSEEGHEGGPWDTAPGESRLKAGIAVRPLPAPVGIPTAGYGQVKRADNPRSPFAENFAATRIVHTPPLVKAVALSKGGETLVIVRLDLIGVFGGFLDAVLARLRADHAVDLDGRVILSCTHTHAGPGRLADHFVTDFAADTFFPEYFDHVIMTIADTVAEALASLDEAEVGVTMTSNAEAHVDRRCENPPLTDDTLGIMVLRRRGEDAPFAVLVNYAVHGTVLQWQDLTLSRDAPGAIEDKVSEVLGFALGVPVETLFLQGAAGDAGPMEFPPDPGYLDVADIPQEWTALEALGRNVAMTVMDAMPTVTWVTDAEATLAVRTARLRIAREVLGYVDDEFPYPDGAIYCGFGQGQCAGEPGDPPRMDCLPLPEDPRLHQTFVTVARIGPAVLATLPGEPLAQVGLDLREAIEREATGSPVFVLGYSQAYFGYILREDDWRQGGYEPSMALWGWRFSDFAIKAVVALLRSLRDPDQDVPFPQAPPLGGSSTTFTPRKAEASRSDPLIRTTPPDVIAQGDTIVVQFTGGDPWLGTPFVVLESASGGEFAPHEITPGAPLSSLGPYATLELAVDPPYETSPGPTDREFLWTLRIPTTREVATSGFPLGGWFRVRIEGAYRKPGESKPTPYVLVGYPFHVKEPPPG